MKDSLLIRTLRGEKGERSPVWFMRQAGRYLPEYRAIREKHSMLEVIRSPELAATVTLQPLDRFPLDGAIIFADLLNPLIGMGIDLDFVAGEGPKIFNPIQSTADVEKLRIPTVEENVGYTIEALKIVSRELNPRGVPVLGFGGAPFTLSYYMIEGKTGANLKLTKSFMTKENQSWTLLQEKLVVLMRDYLIAQADAGASALQIFDSWAGYLSPMEYREFVAPFTKRLIAEVKERSGVPVIYFAPNAAGLFPEITTLGADVYAIDWRMNLSFAAQHTSCPLQGNLDPALLFGDRGYLEKEALHILREGRTIPNPHVFNLGHGLLPETPIDAVARLVELAHTLRD